MLDIRHNLVEITRRIGLSARAFPAIIEAAMRDMERATLRMFRRTTATWRHKPHFEFLWERKGANITVIAGTDDEIYAYVDLGTRPHPIFPKESGGVLVFREGYKPKTVVGQLKSVAGGPFGDVVFARHVQHPGTEGRGFTRIIQEELGKLGPITLAKHLRRWLRKH